jgi:hypothetical protein
LATAIVVCSFLFLGWSICVLLVLTLGRLP